MRLFLSFHILFQWLRLKTAQGFKLLIWGRQSLPFKPESDQIISQNRMISSEKLVKYKISTGNKTKTFRVFFTMKVFRSFKVLPLFVPPHSVSVHKAVSQTDDYDIHSVGRWSRSQVMERNTAPNKLGNKASGATQISQASLPPGCQTPSALRVMLAAGADRAQRWKKNERHARKERQREISLHTRTKKKKDTYPPPFCFLALV